MPDPVSALRERRRYIASVILTAILIALGINLISGWLIDSSNVRRAVLWSGLALILLSLVVSYLGLKPPVQEMRFKTGVFVTPKDGDRITLVSYHHFLWANPEWVDSWDRHRSLLVTLSKNGELSSEEHAVVSGLIFHLILSKICQVSQDWHLNHPEYSGSQETLLPGLPYSLTTPTALNVRASHLEGGSSRIELSSFPCTCLVEVRPTPDSLREVSTTPVFKLVQVSPSHPSTSHVYALGAEVRLALSFRAFGFLGTKAEILGNWFTDIANQLVDECKYADSLSRLEQLIVFEIYRRLAGENGPPVPPVSSVPRRH